jgi:hypothetical protein
VLQVSLRDLVSVSCMYVHTPHPPLANAMSF